MSAPEDMITGEWSPGPALDPAPAAKNAANPSPVGFSSSSLVPIFPEDEAAAEASSGLRRYSDVR